MHGGSQAVRLPKAFRFEGGRVCIEKRGEEVILRPVKPPHTLAGVAAYLASAHPHAEVFPDVERPKKQQSRDLNW